MFWIILMIINLGTALYINIFIPGGWWEGGTWALIIYSWSSFSTLFFINLSMIIQGTHSHGNLLESKQEYDTYIENLELVRKAYRKLDGSQATMVSGDIANINLAKGEINYIKELTKLKAEYNSALVKAQFWKKSKLGKIFSYGFAYSKKILDLKIIE